MAETLFRAVVGDTPKARILEFLIEGRELDYSLSDIAEGSGIGRTTLFRVFPSLVKTMIVEYTRDIGNAKLYRINMQNEFVNRLINLFDVTLKDSLKVKGKIVVSRRM